MEATRIVESVYVFEDFHLSLPSGVPRPARVEVSIQQVGRNVELL